MTDTQAPLGWTVEQINKKIMGTFDVLMSAPCSQTVRWRLVERAYEAQDEAVRLVTEGDAKGARLQQAIVVNCLAALQSDTPASDEDLFYEAWQLTLDEALEGWTVDPFGEAPPRDGPTKEVREQHEALRDAWSDPACSQSEEVFEGKLMPWEKVAEELREALNYQLAGVLSEAAMMSNWIEELLVPQPDELNMAVPIVDSLIEEVLSEQDNPKKAKGGWKSKLPFSKVQSLFKRRS